MGLFATPARADALLLPPRDDVAGARPQPEFDPVDMRLGTWTLAPEIGVNEGYDSNIFGLSQDAVGDGYVVVTPSVRLGSDWGRHGVDLSASSTLTRYLHHERQNSDEYSLNAKGHVDLPEATVTLSTGWDRTVERRGINGIPLTLDRPSLVTSAQQAVDIKHDRGQFGVDLSLSRQTTSYSDIVRLDGSFDSQRFRDQRSWAADARFGYVATSSIAFGVALGYRHSDAPFSPGRESNAASAQVSGVVDLGIARVESDIGYLDHRFSSPLFKDFKGLTFRSTAYWYPTTLLTVSLRADRSLEPSGDPTAGAILGTGIRGRVDYELMRNFVLHADIGSRLQRYRDTARRTVSRDFGVNGEYSFNRSVAIGAYARRECRDSSGTTVERHFCSSLVGIALKLRR